MDQLSIDMIHSTTSEVLLSMSVTDNDETGIKKSKWLHTSSRREG